MALSPGTRLGVFEVTARIGEGGMGAVYRATDTSLGRQVAIKVLSDVFAKDAERLVRFEREAKTLASLNHPNIAAIYGLERSRGTQALVMELVEGEDLSQRIARGAIPVEEALPIAKQIAEALEAAHEQGIIHRDLKPANVKVRADGMVKVLDFGLAKAMEPAAGSSPSMSMLRTSTTPAMTQAGMIIGTAAYMSPEQARGKTVDKRADIWAFGAVLFEMLTGQQAFPGEHIADTLAAVVKLDPPWGSVGADVPSRVRQVLRVCLEKDPRQRVQAIGDVRLALGGAFETAAPVTVPVATSKVVDSIAVLPFTDARGDPDTEYLCDGITESILNSLARIGQLRITPRSTVFRYKTREPDPLAVGRELDVRLVLTGRVIQRGETLVVGTELVDVVAGAQLWGERYHRKLSDIFELEEEIARKISESLRMKLTGEEKSRLVKRFTENTEAYQLYLRGRYHWIRRTPDHLKKAVEYFQQTIAKDPAYALAYSGLADCYSILALFSVVTSKDGFARAKAAAAAAAAMAPDLAEGHTSLAFIRAYFDCDWAAADEGFQRALEINPGYWVTPYWYSFSMMSRAREQEAEQQVRHALELEPLSPAVLHAAALASVMAHRYDEAAERCLRGLEYDPGYFQLRLWLGLVYQCQEKYAEAVDEFEKACDLSGGVSFAVGALGNAQAVVGNRDEASRMLQQLLDESERVKTNYYQIALIYAGLGDTESVLLWLEKACEARDAFLPMLVKVDPRMHPVHGDPRYQKVLQRLNLA